jgi:hypothetical protein
MSTDIAPRPLTEHQKFIMLQAMQSYGGGFASALADAWIIADAGNSLRLEAAFPGMVHLYGPGSRFYEAIERITP